MIVKVNITRNDWVAFLFFEELHQPATRNRLLIQAFGPSGGIALVLFLILAHFVPGPVRFATSVLPALLVFPLYLFPFWLTKRRLLAQSLDKPLKDGQAPLLLGDCEFSLSEEGVTMTRDSFDTVHLWHEVQTVVSNGNYCYLTTRSGDTLIAPRRCFDSEEMFQLFVKTAVIYHWNYGKNPPSPAASSGAASSDAANPGQHTLEPLPPIRL